MKNDEKILPGPHYKADRERLENMVSDRVAGELTKALETLCADIQAVYIALAAGNTPTISSGMFGRLNMAQDMIKHLRACGVVA